jgi:holo-[acyl-carrier protein] synthase
MDIVGIGTNIVECVRIGRLIERHGEAFLERFFTPREIRACRDRADATRHYAGQWAAKEAVLKALGSGLARRVCWTDVEVRPTAGRTWRVHVGGAARDRAEALRVADVLLTISHCRSYATAYAVAVRRDGRGGA